MSGLFSQPKAPSVNDLMQQQTQANAASILQQQHANMINQTDAYGNRLNFNQIGTWGGGKGGKGGDPRYEAVTTLSPDQQYLLDLQEEGQKQYGQTALNLFGQAKENLSTPFKYDVGDYEKWASGMYDKLTGDTNAANERALDTKLSNQGVYSGSTGARDAMGDYYYGRDKAKTDYMANAFDTGRNYALQERELPLNEATQMLTGVQAQQPQFGSTPQVSVPTFDAAGAAMNQYNQQLQSSQSDWGALAGILGAGIGGWGQQGFNIPKWLSDRRAKQDIKKVGKLNDGTNVYQYKYRAPFGGGLTHLGVMAQEVQKTHPDAVSERPDGLLQVDYGKLGEEAA